VAVHGTGVWQRRAMKLHETTLYRPSVLARALITCVVLAPTVPLLAGGASSVRLHARVMKFGSLLV
jgi:hypothetical protein